MNKLLDFAERLPKDLGYLVFATSGDEGFGGCNIREHEAKTMEVVISKTMADDPTVRLAMIAGVFNYAWNHPDAIPLLEKGVALLREDFEEESKNLFNDILENERNDAE